jgi:hypothetical protein
MRFVMGCCSHKRWETLGALAKAVSEHSSKGLMLCQMVSAGAPLGAIQAVMESRHANWTPQGVAALEFRRYVCEGPAAVCRTHCEVLLMAVLVAWDSCAKLQSLCTFREASASGIQRFFGSEGSTYLAFSSKHAQRLCTPCFDAHIQPTTVQHPDLMPYAALCCCCVLLCVSAPTAVLVAPSMGWSSCCTPLPS